jgi:transposase
VESLDLVRLGCARAQAACTGRPADDPRDVLTLSIYGDRNRIRSSRRLARETHRHVERSWLLRQLRPDVKTIADFRKHHTKALHALFRALVLLCRQVELFGAALLAIDGRTCKAVTNNHQHFTPATLEKALKDSDAQVEPSGRDLDATDREASRVHQPTSAELQKKIESRKERQQRDHGYEQAITASGEPPLSRPEPESRTRPQSPKVAVGDHMQMAVDSQHQRSVAQDVTQAVTAADQLSPMARRAKERLGVARLRAVADLDYAHGQEINAWDEAGSEAYGPTPSTSANTKLGLCGKERCSDDPQQDCYWGPAGTELTCRGETTARGRHIRYEATAACRRCPRKEQCTSNNEGRRMTRGVDEHLLERMEERLKANPAIMQERKQLGAHPCGPLTHANDQGSVRMKGLKTVRAEVSLSCVADSLKRAINLLGGPQRLGALSEGGHR